MSEGLPRQDLSSPSKKPQLNPTARRILAEIRQRQAATPPPEPKPNLTSLPPDQRLAQTAGPAEAAIFQEPEQGAPRELGLKFSGRSIPSINHPQRNEDHMAHSATGGFAMVLDGVGGLHNGDKASLVARDYIARSLRKIPQDIDPETAKRQVADALMEASAGVATKAPGGQTTATVVKLIESGGAKRAIIGHVGDSRAYILRGERLIQTTEDDSILSTAGLTLPEQKALGAKLDAVETQLDLDRLSPQERAYFYRRNIIFRALGEEEPPQPHIYHVALLEGDKIVLTSDGVHDNLSQREIDQIIRSNSPDIAAALAQQALARSQQGVGHIRAKPDDISALVVEVGKTN